MLIHLVVEIKVPSEVKIFKNCKSKGRKTIKEEIRKMEKTDLRAVNRMIQSVGLLQPRISLPSSLLNGL